MKLRCQKYLPSLIRGLRRCLTQRPYRNFSKRTITCSRLLPRTSTKDAYKTHSCEHRLSYLYYLYIFIILTFLLLFLPLATMKRLQKQLHRNLVYLGCLAYPEKSTDDTDQATIQNPVSNTCFSTKTN